MIRPDLAAIPAYVPGTSDPEALKLSSNEVAGQPLPAAAEAMAKAAITGNRYPDMGTTQLRTALGKHLGVDPGNIAVGCGSSALCQQLAQATSTPENNIVFPWRSFEAYPIFCRIAGAEPRPVPLLDDGHLDLHTIASTIDERTSLVYLCSPNNPSGAVVTRAEFDDFMARVPAHVTVALDEAYVEFNRDPDAVNGCDVWREHDNVLCLRTFSKAYGLAGVRIGYAFGHRDLIDAVNKVGVPFQVSAIAQAGALASLHHSDELLARLEDTVEVRDEVADRIGAARSQANFVWLPAEKCEREPADIAADLARRGVLVRAFPEGLRVTVTNCEEANEFLSAWDAVT
ncbi:histidinol-phosphate transaminase [Corynebacterium sp. CCUG 69979]|uniref:histidinol-phosphate transaminase n=1 Tax=Corynebacterium sp. CCUG 69979 TaxID=2823890 RepID=UPI00210D6BC2|nr:histidinol-phosphate transaminase [Corynebacterium sp. CCUG 69979]MCQ4624483.1 histidinol-phosphate transaminase [Corynebacterium sp. CCUG 69979]